MAQEQIQHQDGRGDRHANDEECGGELAVSQLRAVVEADKVG